ncbi:ATP-dependent DNA ligase, partial [Mitsuaria sp. TWR114]|uniref:DNA polymerase ligase N-terminal domain-containing protein n=1 Tax=Mitsuaria sp. TWR114 TaxID=2601731 RepID=UPI0011C2E844
LELDGVLLSWAVPKGPSYDPKERRMAIHVEDHPLSYGGFEGTIPPRQYGAGEVIVWDNGTWEPEGDPAQGLRDGKLVFRLHGQKLAGLWQLVRTSRDAAKREQWLLIKKHDGRERAHADYDVTLALPDSVIQHPLGLIEEREAGEADAAAATPDLSRARKARLPAELRRSSRRW